MGKFGSGYLCIPYEAWSLRKNYLIYKYCRGVTWTPYLLKPPATPVFFTGFRFKTNKMSNAYSISLCDGNPPIPIGFPSQRQEWDKTLSTLITRFMGPTWGPSGPTGPRWASCWPHEICYLGSFFHWLSHWSRNKTAAISQTTFTNAFHERKCMYFTWDFTEVCSYNYPPGSPCVFYGWVPRA